MTFPRYKILFLAGSYPNKYSPVSGIFIRKHALAISRSSDLYVLYLHPDPDLKDQRMVQDFSCENGIRTLRCYYKPLPATIRFVSGFANLMLHTMVGISCLREIAKRFGRPDILHISLPRKAGLIPLIWKLIKGIPYIITEHSTEYTAWDGSYAKLSYPNRLLTQIIYRHASAITAVSRSLLDALRSQRLVKSNDTVIPNVIDPAPRDMPVRKDRPPLRIITISMLNDRQKNVSGLLKAFHDLEGNHPDIELHILGDGDDKERLVDLASDLGMLNRSVFFHGYVPNEEIHRYFRNSHFFVLNSDFETFSVATAESLAHGVPVVVTRSGGPEEYVSGELGILVDRRDVEGLVRGLEFMVENWSEFDPQVLRTSVMDRFGEEKVGRQFLELYRSLLAT